MASSCGGNPRGKKRFTVEQCLEMLDDSDIDISDDELINDDFEECNEKAFEILDSIFEDTVDVENEAEDGRKDAKIEWVQKDFEQPEAIFNRESDYVNIGPGEETKPIEFFGRYFTEDLLEKMALETNLYAVLINGNSLKTNKAELRKFLGINILMGNFHLPRVRMYWGSITRIPSIADVMPVNRFFKLRNNLHVVSQREPPPENINKFWKVEPVLDAVRKRCLELKHEEFSSVDEQMIPFTGRAPAKQFVKSKPNPVGIKNFVICGKSGKAHDFELYQGKGTGIFEEHKKLGLGASIVLRLAKSVPRFCNYKVCFDNYFTGFPLIRELRRYGILSLGVIKGNRMQGCIMKSKSELKKEGRGAMDSRTSKEGDLIVVRWCDNGIVQLASNLVGIGTCDKVKRWSQAEKTHIQVDRPEIVKIYNESKGGVDKLDFLIALYRIHAKTKKWPVRVMLHFVDFALANSWLEYREQQQLIGTSPRKIYDLLQYRGAVAEALIKAEPDRRPGRPRHSVLPALEEGVPPKKRSASAAKPIEEVRFDSVGHWPEHLDGLGQRCKMEGCAGRSRIKCTKCNIFLCLTKDRNCFKAFHLKNKV